MVESTPDTIVTLLSGEKLMVLESTGEVVNAANNHWKRVHQEPPGDHILGQGQVSAPTLAGPINERTGRT
jgi:hypothetical protein